MIWNLIRRLDFIFFNGVHKSLSFKKDRLSLVRPRLRRGCWSQAFETPVRQSRAPHTPPRGCKPARPKAKELLFRNKKQIPDANDLLLGRINPLLGYRSHRIDAKNLLLDSSKPLPGSRNLFPGSTKLLLDARKPLLDSSKLLLDSIKLLLGSTRLLLDSNKPLLGHLERPHGAG